jgi:hypothetical protein
MSPSKLQSDYLSLFITVCTYVRRKKRDGGRCTGIRTVPCNTPQIGGIHYLPPLSRLTIARDVSPVSSAMLGNRVLNTLLHPLAPVWLPPQEAR